jgi:hypothetical protein
MGRPFETLNQGLLKTCYIKLHEENIHFLIKLSVYNYGIKVSLFMYIKKLFCTQINIII